MEGRGSCGMSMTGKGGKRRGERAVEGYSSGSRGTE